MQCFACDDFDGTVTLLGDAKRRSENGELHASQFDVIKAALEPCRTYSATGINYLYYADTSPGRNGGH